MMMLSCRETSRLLSEGADRYLHPRERLAVRLHLWMCAPCRRLATQLQWLRTVVRRHQGVNDDDPSVGYADLPPGLRRRIQALAADYGAESAACKKTPLRDD